VLAERVGHHGGVVVRIVVITLLPVGYATTSRQATPTTPGSRPAASDCR